MVKLLEENRVSKLPDMGPEQWFFAVDNKSKGNRTKDKWNCIKLKVFCTTKEIINEKTTYGMGENICKQYNRLRFDIQNMQRTQTTE